MEGLATASDAPPTAKRRRSTGQGDSLTPPLAGRDSEGKAKEGEGDGLARTMRRTQRAPLSCTNCSRRKIKCSKTTIPCVQCLARGEGHVCSRETVVTSRGGRIVEAGTIRTVEDLLEENARLRAELAAAKATPPTDISATSSSPSTVRLAGPASPTFSTFPSAVLASASPAFPSSLGLSASSEERTELERVATAMNLLELGRDRNGEEHVSYSPIPTPTDPSAPSPPDSLPFDATDLPSLNLSTQLLSFALTDLAWIYSTCHSPSFLQEHQRFLAYRQQGEIRKAVDGLGFGWLALLFSYQALAAHNLPDDLTAVFGVTNRQETAQLYFNISVQCLDSARFLSTPSLLTAQAIASLSHIFHIYGSVTLRSSLLAIAIRTAQQLGAHLCGEELPCERKRVPYSACAAHGVVSEHLAGSSELIQREVKKRVWWLLLHLDWVTVPIGLPFATPLEHLEVALPLNLSDLALPSSGTAAVAIPPLSSPTSQSFHIARSRLSRLMHRFYSQYRSLPRGHPARLALAEQTDDALIHHSSTSTTRTSSRPTSNCGYRKREFSSAPSLRTNAYSSIATFGEIVDVLDAAQGLGFVPSKMITHWLAAANFLALDYRFSTTATTQTRQDRRHQINKLLSAVRDGDRFEPHAPHVIKQIEALLVTSDAIHAAASAAVPVAEPTRPAEQALPYPVPSFIPMSNSPSSCFLFDLPPPSDSTSEAMNPALLALFGGYQNGFETGPSSFLFFLSFRLPWQNFEMPSFAGSNGGQAEQTDPLADMWGIL
ncbi:hypothetical protein JCM8547_005856 [Rhodosporidiobolus lusitaniae]